MDDRPEPSGAHPHYWDRRVVVRGLAFFTERHETQSRGPRLAFVEPFQEEFDLHFETPNHTIVRKNANFAWLRIENSGNEDAENPRIFVGTIEGMEKGKKVSPVQLLSKTITHPYFRRLPMVTDAPTEEELAYVVSSRLLEHVPAIPDGIIGSFILGFAFEGSDVFYFVSDDPHGEWTPHPLMSVWTLLITGKASARSRSVLAKLDKQTIRLVWEKWNEARFETVGIDEVKKLWAERTGGTDDRL
jgi:hypothetical protein